MSLQKSLTIRATLNYLELFTNEEEKTGKPGAVDIGSNKKGRASSNTQTRNSGGICLKRKCW